ncbi:MAG: UDP-N-acetylmuramate dehydrogenase [Bacillota bacterium]|nr:UDP-N-acetylmuramate dehydrogenase [Bacillota bacterium]
MERENLLKALEDLDLGKIFLDEPMKNHTTFKVGGPADILIMPKDEASLVKLMTFLRNHNIEAFILGQGSNLLVTDKGIRGIVVKIHDCLTDLYLEDETSIYSGAGITVPRLAKFAQDQGLTGMEEISGIPGDVGGGVFMNAGAYGKEFKDVIKEVKVLTRDNQVKLIKNADMDFHYRGSQVKSQGYIVLGASFSLEKGIQADIDEKMADYTARRRNKQPIEWPSAGSTFKRPEGYYAGALIEEAGLKGLVHRGAMVSEKHSGFVINHNNGTYQDIIELIKLIQKEVYDKSGVVLEREVKIVGEE